MVERRVSPTGVAQMRLLPPGHGVVQVMEHGRAVKTREEPISGSRRVIVQFRSMPAALARLSAGSTGAQALDLERLRADLRRLSLPQAAKSGGGAPAVAVITHEYREVTSGAALTLDPRLIDTVRALPYVQAVFEDTPVHATLSESVPLIQADRVRTEYGVTGAGLRVGIIDTGIDYDHAAFGAGFGPGHRVAGGYDYANTDPDPWDDHGHGTHVAGIVGGNGGGVVGVAPEVTLYAFKVLDAAGVGYTSAILAAFEDVPDPDHNPATNDGMQVVNMSFGAPGGRSDDILALGVDTLVELGVVCAVAAGNDGWYMTIGTPGTARRALTVAATDKLDSLASFSSRGPVSDNLDLKPDVAAPGVDILSARAGGGTLALSGTSMATPHVAGVAVLLRQLNPTWTPDDVKSAIVATAIDVGRTPLEVGAGRVDAFHAAGAEIATSPTHLGYGMVDLAASVWIATDTLEFHNLLDEARTVQLPDSLVLGPGAVLHVAPAGLTLPAHGTAPVHVTLVVDNALTPFPLATPFAYTGVLTASSDGVDYRVPVSFHKSCRLTAQSPGWIYQLNVVERATGNLVYSDSGVASIFLPPGDYDLMASFFPDWIFVVHQNVHLTGDQTEVIDPAEATVHLTWNNVDATGAPVDCNDAKFSYVGAANTGLNFIGFPFTEIWSSPTEAYRFEWERAATNDRDWRITFNGTVEGFTASGTVANQPAQLHHVPIDVPAVAADSAAMLFFPIAADGFGGWLGFSWLRDVPAYQGAWTFDQWIMNAPTHDHYSLGEQFQLYAYDANGQIDLMTAWPDYYAPTIRFDEGWPLPLYSVYAPFQRGATFGGERMRLGTGMPVWRATFQNTAQSIVLDQAPDAYLLHCEHDMYGGVGVTPDPAYVATQGGQVVASGMLDGFGSVKTVGTFEIPLPDTTAVDFEATRTFDLRGRPASLSAVAHVNPAAADPNPPALTSWQLLADGAAVDSIDFSTAAGVGLRFRVVDDGVPAPATVSVRSVGSSTWTPLSQQLVGADYLATLPVDLDGPIDVRLESQDASGNGIRLTWSPGFMARGAATTAVEPPPARPGVLALAGPSRNPVRDPVLRIAFSLSSAEPARLALHDVQGREILTRALEGLAAGSHEIELGRETPLAPGIYFLRLTQGGLSRTAKVCVLRR